MLPPKQTVVQVEFSLPAMDRHCGDDVDHMLSQLDDLDEATFLSASNHSSCSSHYSAFRPTKRFYFNDDDDDDDFDVVEEFSLDQQHQLQQHQHLPTIISSATVEHDADDHYYYYTKVQQPQQNQQRQQQHGVVSTTVTTFEFPPPKRTQQPKQQQQQQHHHHHHHHPPPLVSQSRGNTNCSFVRFATDEKGRLLTEVWKFPKYSRGERKTIWYQGRDFKSFTKRAQVKAARCNPNYRNGLQNLRTACSSSFASSSGPVDTTAALLSMPPNTTTTTTSSSSSSTTTTTKTTPPQPQPPQPPQDPLQLQTCCRLICASTYRGLEPFVDGIAEQRKRIIQSILEEQQQWQALGNILTDDERTTALGDFCRAMTKPHRQMAHLLATGDAMIVRNDYHSYSNHHHHHHPRRRQSTDHDEDDDLSRELTMDPGDCGKVEI